MNSGLLSSFNNLSPLNTSKISIGPLTELMQAECCLFITFSKLKAMTNFVNTSYNKNVAEVLAENTKNFLTENKTDLNRTINGLEKQFRKKSNHKSIKNCCKNKVKITYFILTFLPQFSILLRSDFLLNGFSDRQNQSHNRQQNFIQHFFSHYFIIE